MVGPFPIAPTIARIGDQVSALKIIGSAADLKTALAQRPGVSPACYVVREERGQAPKGYTGRMVQDVNAGIQCVLFVRNASGQASGTGARADMDALQGNLRTALLGWYPESAYQAMWFQASTDGIYDAAWLVSVETFRTTYRIQVPA